jgi:hypothetical protein
MRKPLERRVYNRPVGGGDPHLTRLFEPRCLRVGPTGRLHPGAVVGPHTGTVARLNPQMDDSQSRSGAL